MEVFPFWGLCNIVVHGFSFFHKIGEICQLVEPAVKSALAKLERSACPVVSVSENGKSLCSLFSTRDINLIKHKSKIE